MRNAAATFDDFGTSGSTRKGGGRPRPAGGTTKKKKAPRRAPFNLNGVARYAAIGMAATMALGIIVNALMLQKGHHPAPLFAKAAAVSPTPVAAPRVAPVPVRAAEADAVPAAAAEVAPTKNHRIASATHAEAPGGDAIGRLLAGGAPPSTKSQSVAAKTGDGRAAGAKTGDTRTVSGAQRALTKLGFTVPATGTVGPATRKAIEAFQKNRHLPVKGELDRKMVKLLSTESGVKID